MTFASADFTFFVFLDGFRCLFCTMTFFLQSAKQEFARNYPGLPNNLRRQPANRNAIVDMCANYSRCAQTALPQE
jgi:hypothetical protein